MARVKKGPSQLRIGRVPLGMALVVVWVLLMVSLTRHGVDAQNGNSDTDADNNNNGGGGNDTTTTTTTTTADNSGNNAETTAGDTDTSNNGSSPAEHVTSTTQSPGTGTGSASTGATAGSNAGTTGSQTSTLGGNETIANTSTGNTTDSVTPETHLGNATDAGNGTAPSQNGTLSNGDGSGSSQNGSLPGNPGTHPGNTTDTGNSTAPYQNKNTTDTSNGTTANQNGTLPGDAGTDLGNATGSDNGTAANQNGTLPGVTGRNDTDSGNGTTPSPITVSDTTIANAITTEGSNNGINTATCQNDTCVHGQCSDTGGTVTCQCDNGWRGDNCSEAMCLDDTCDHGQCNDTGGTVRCQCDEGWTGDSCDEDVNECDQSPCVNAYYCENKVGSYECHCTEGWTGMNCIDDIDECSNRSWYDCIAHSTCLNNNGSYTCPCDEGYEILPGADSCTEQVLLSFNNSFTSREYGEDQLFGPFSIPGGFKLDNGIDVTAYYISIDGYITFNNKFSSPTMPDTDSPRLSNVLFLAPYWADIDIPASQDQGVTSGLYHVALSLNDTFYDNDTKALFDDYKDGIGFEPTFIAVVTWVNVLPYRAADFPNFQAATFQVALFTDGEQTTARLAWRNVWPDSANLKVSAARFFTGQSVTNMTITVPPQMQNVTIATDQDPKTTTAKCVQWLATEGRQLPASGAPRIACPCSWEQVLLDAVFEARAATNCATSKVFDVSGLQQVCCYSATSGLLDTDVYTAKLPQLPVPSSAPGPSNTQNLPNNNDIVTDGFNKCCSKTTATSSSCAAFRELFPVDTCSRRDGVTQVGMWGSLHLAGAWKDSYFRYTYNARGEYKVLSTDYSAGEHGIPFEMQMRTDKIPDFNLTVIKVLAMKYGDSPIAEIRFVSGHVKLYVNGTETAPYLIPPDIGVALNYITPNYVLEIALSIGAVLKVTARTDGLSLIVTWSEGALDPSKLDGLLSPRVLAEAQVKLTTEPWLGGGKFFHVAQNESLFRYAENGTDGDYASFQYPDFVPDLGPSLDEQKTKLAETNNTVCNGTDFERGGQQCIEDILLTGKDELAQESKGLVENMLVNVNKLGEKPPMFVAAPDVWYLTTATSLMFTRDIRVSAQNITLTASTVNGLNFTIENKTGEVFSFVWYVDEDNLKTIAQWTLSFKALSSLTNMAAVYSPDIIACACASADQCDNTVAEKTISEITWSHEGKLYLSNCQCGLGKTGRFCQDDLSVCDLCFENATCDVNATESSGVCTSCPQGYSGDGVKCYEIDECLQDVCDQKCTNTQGSYTCSCNPNYELYGNRTCKDVNECRQKPPKCNDTQFCENEVDGYVCLCRPGFMLAENTCEKALRTYGGVIAFLSVKGQEWSEDLKNPASQNFTDLAGKVVKVVMDRLKSVNIDVVGVTVVKFILFESKPNNRKRRSVSGSEQPIIKANYQIGTNAAQNETVLDNAMTAGFPESCSSNLCPYGDLKGVSKSDSGIEVNYDLCSSDRNNNCHDPSTECITQDGQALCQCRQGYEKWSLSENACLDRDECQQNTTLELCGMAESSGVSCNNTVGSYYCTCPETHQWDADAKTCLAKRNLCAMDNPCLNGAECVSTEDTNGVACRCKDGWAGLYCGDEDAEAEKMKIALIVVGSVLGGLCLILLIALMVVCIAKRRRKGKDLDSSYETSSGGPGPIPRPHVGPPHGYSGGADPNREMKREDSMHKYTDFRRNDPDVDRNGSSRGSQHYTNPVFTRDEERL